MAVTNFSPLLGLALPTTGDLTGTWGDVVNTQITDLLDDAVAGTTTLTADANTLLSTTQGGDNQARQAILNCTGARTAIRTITAPAQSKAYVVINGTTGGFDVRLVGAGPTAGVTIPAGRRVLVAWNGTDFVVVAGGLVDLTTGVTGVLPVVNGGTALSSVGANGQVLTVVSGAPAWTSPSVSIGPLVYNTTTVNTNITIPSGQNAFTVGPVTINSGSAVTVSTGQRWVVV